MTQPAPQRSAIGGRRISLSDLFRAAGWIVATGTVLLIVQAAIRSDHVPIALRVLIAALVLLSFARPADGLLVTAALIPVASAGASQLSAPFGREWCQVLVVSFIAGWLLSVARARGPSSGRDAIAAPAWTLAALALASCVVQVAALAVRFEPYRPKILQLVSRTYFADNIDLRVVVETGVVLEGLALFGIVIALTARDDLLKMRLLRMLVAGAAAAAVLNIFALVSAAMRQESFITGLAHHLMKTRINIHYPDANAAGSYFAMMVFLAAGLAAYTRRVHWWVVTAVIALALWMTNSRTAVLTVVVVLVASILFAAVRQRGSARLRLAAVLTAVVITVAGAGLFVYFQRNTPLRPADQGMRLRTALAVAAGRMVKEHPAFGVGITRFYWLSTEHLPKWFVEYYYRRENAHNNWLQILAELGITGFAAFLWLVAAVGWRVRAGPASPASTGVAVGLITFLLTALGGHPLLMREVSYAFWLTLGLCAAFMPAAAPSRRLRAATVVLVALVAISVPFRTKAEMQQLELEHVAWGVSRWSPAAEGPRWRTVGRRAVFFAPADAVGVVIPLRAINDTDPPRDVDILFEGRLANSISTRGREWIRVNLVLPPAKPKGFYHIELIVRGPAVPGADDTINAGIEMGWIEPTRYE